jgi:hypothetical protein
MAKPGTVQTREISWNTLILQANPDHNSEKQNEKLFEFSNGRVFRGNHNKQNTAYPDE